MSKTVIDCGNCSPDHGAFQRLVQRHFGVSVIQTHGVDDTLAALASTESVDLVTVNRLLDRDGSEGMNVIQAIKSSDQYQSVPVMLITNYPDHQRAAVEAGCVHGFGKLSLRDPETLELLSTYLSDE